MTNTTVKLSKELQNITARLDKHIQEVTSEKLGFTLLIFTGDVVQYASNCDRAESIHEIRQMLDYWEKGMPDVQAHHVN